MGLNVFGAIKGPDSVRVGVDWLMSKHIHITERSTNLISEFENYCWKESKNGDFLPAPIDDYNHGIDATRYACSEHIGFRGNVAEYSATDLGL